MKTTLDLSSLAKAIVQLEDAIACHQANSNPRLALHLRAGAIQAFEFTYELAFKSLRRFLLATEPNPDRIGNMTFNEVIRLGYGRGLLSVDVAGWSAFRRDRGTTSHAYDESKALEVFEGIPAFVQEAQYLHHQLTQRLASGA